MDYGDWHFGAPLGVFGFIIIIVLINAVASVLRTRSKQNVLREAIKSGQSIDPEIMKSFSADDESGDSGPTAGFVLMGIALGLVFMGYQLGKAGVTDEPIFDIMLGVAGIPFMIGLVIVIAGLVTRRKT